MKMMNKMPIGNTFDPSVQPYNEIRVKMTFSGIYPIQFIAGEEYTFTLPDGSEMVFLCETMPTLRFVWLRTLK